MIALVDDSSAITADHWNDLFAEFDAKISRVMDSKTWILTGDPTILPLMGISFFFTNGPRPQSSFLGGVGYDHKTFTDLAATIPAIIDPVTGNPRVDADKKLLFIEEVSSADKDAIAIPQTDLFFDHCLEALRRFYQPPVGDADYFWLVETISDLTGNLCAQKIYRYAQAELIIEGDGLDQVRLEETWNKFNFFRIHNCNGYDVTVDFAGYHQVVVPRWGIKCVRRDAVDQGYLDGFNFFHRFKSGDPRLYELPHDTSTPAGTQGANNVVCPSIVYRVIQAFTNSVTQFSPQTGENWTRYGLGGNEFIAGPKLGLDPHQVLDVSGTHQGYFPASG